MVLQIMKLQLHQLHGDHTAMKASYAYGPVTVAYSRHDYDSATVIQRSRTTS